MTAVGSQYLRNTQSLVRMLTAHNTLHDIYRRKQGMQSERTGSITRHDARDLNFESRDICDEEKAEIDVSVCT